ncbi:MAG: hypothetical protein MUE56_00710 [Ignavibacteria bacterium]|jgi:hypothetical protein|nr:hypothetical protein [Ignavibacteria bacterium]
MKIFTHILILLVSCGYVYSQPFSPNSNYFRTDKENAITSSGPFTSVSLGMGVILYLINPIIVYEDKKIYMGLTKEFSVGFGKFGEHRAAFEYSFLFTGNISHHARLSYKYDLLLKKNMEPSHTLQGSSVLSLGAGYFTDFHKNGIFPELTYGYSLRNHKLLLYPHVKIRYTFMFKKSDFDIMDLSFGIIIGLANPFIDVKIKKDH